MCIWVLTSRVTELAPVDLRTTNLQCCAWMANHSCHPCTRTRMEFNVHWLHSNFYAREKHTNTKPFVEKHQILLRRGLHTLTVKHNGQGEENLSANAEDDPRWKLFNKRNYNSAEKKHTLPLLHGTLSNRDVRGHSATHARSASTVLVVLTLANLVPIKVSLQSGKI